MASDKRCGTCELLERSDYPGLHQFGKCPHRSGWVRTQEAGCEHHASDRPKPLVRIAMVLNGSLVALSLGTFVVLDVRNGTLVSHVILGSILVIGVVFLLLVRRFGMFSEEPKYDVLDHADPPPEEDREPPWWLDPR
jgi:hypothetical protein